MALQFVLNCYLFGNKYLCANITWYLAQLHVVLCVLQTLNFILTCQLIKQFFMEKRVICLSRPPMFSIKDTKEQRNRIIFFLYLMCTISNLTCWPDPRFQIMRLARSTISNHAVGQIHDFKSYGWLDPRFQIFQSLVERVKHGIIYLKSFIIYNIQKKIFYLFVAICVSNYTNKTLQYMCNDCGVSPMLWAPGSFGPF